MNDLLTLNLSKQYPDFQLTVSASFPSGIVAVFGPSGSGKTTLLNCIAGLTDPDEGEIYLADETLFSTTQNVRLSPEKRRVGYMFQNSLLFPHLSIKENIYYGYKLTPPALRRIQPTDLVELLEIGQLLYRRPENLSEGEKQRVVLARALATSPRLLLLDEPLASLHMGIKGRIIRYLKAVNEELEIPMVYVSHSISEVLALASRVLVLNAGSQVIFDSPSQALSRPSLASYLSPESLENILEVTISEHHPSRGISVASLNGMNFTLAHVKQEIGNVISIAIKASDIILSAEKPQKISARNVLKGRVQDVYQLGYRVIIRVDIGLSLLVEITLDALEHLDLDENNDVYIIVKSSSITILD